METRTKQSNWIKLTVLHLLLTPCIYGEQIAKISDNPREVLQYVAKLLPHNPTILEAGAFNGNETVTMAKLWPYSKIHAFEPIPMNFNKLQQSTAHFSHINCYNLALCDKNGESEFFWAEDKKNPGIANGSGSLLAPQDHVKYDTEIIFPKKIKVQTMTLDSWAQATNIKSIDFMWLDMQGAELSMLQASKNILPTVKVIYIEVIFVKAYKDQPIYSEIKEWLSDQGFEVIALDFDEKHANLGSSIPVGQAYFGNAVFINSKYRNKNII